jgi:hypothetical protein
MQTLLANLNKCQVLTDPFPHLVVANALPEDLCLRLVSEYPPLNIFEAAADGAGNQFRRLPASQTLNCPEITPLWREFVRLHTAKIFFDQIVNLFGEHVRSIYPSLENYLGPLDGLRTGVRYVDDFHASDILLDAQICVNTPVVQTPSSVRRVHVDSSFKLFAGLYYLRHPDDDSTGGDLEICRFKKRPYGFKGAEIDDCHVEVVKTIKYERNMLVLFVNNLRALHGVTVRSVTPFPRCLFNLVCEVARPLFDIEQYQENEKGSGLVEALKGFGAPVRRKL